MRQGADPWSLQRRRESLRLRSAELRARLGRQTEELAAPLALADMAFDGLRWLRAHPQWPMAAVTVWVVIRPRRALRWLGRAWSLWRGARWLLKSGAP
jgi:hypothetical protein